VKGTQKRKAMNAYLNYIIEANVGLLVVLLLYKVLLSRETRFGMMRFYLLASILACLFFPLIDFQLGDGTSLSISNVIPSYWLPEVTIYGDGAKSAGDSPFGVWGFAAIVYLSGLAICFSLLTFQLIRLWQTFRKATTYRINQLHVAESSEDKPTFSFFNFIFIGKANELTEQEKEQIIRHESVHARQRHSFDILLINTLKILFWFNPLMHTYQKIFIQLHEFEADARAVESTDVNKYCSLLARVALQSADFTMANHFNHSLTVKRIEMMRTIKRNIKQWKVVALAATFPLVFFLVACQDQIGEDIREITRNSSHALIVPEFVQTRFDQVQKQNPDRKYVLLELNETASRKLETLKGQYGLPKSMEVMKAVNGQRVMESVTGQASNIGIDAGGAPGAITSKPGEQTFAILEFNENASRMSEAAAQDKVFTVVEEQPEFPGGYDKMIAFIQENLRYPSNARQQGIEGTVYVSFIVEKDGAVTDSKVIRGISPECDQEVIRMMKLSPNWLPGKQGGEPVRVRFVLPIKFALGQ
ncbi:MAG: M56 family metallopeptidase, partial [Bacteroidota bacterium]|nr:M56 family metallopeptidase [Bacteroidota bacterium]